MTLYQEGCHIVDRIVSTPGWRARVSKEDHEAVVQFPRRGVTRASKLALVRLERILEKVTK